MVRNFWVEGDIDGQATQLRGGPRGPDGGVLLRIYQRQHGKPVLALIIEGNAEDGRLTLTAVDPGIRTVFERRTGR